MIKVVCGANSQEVEVAGKSIGEVRKLLGETLNIPKDAKPVISGDNVSDNYVIKPGDTLEFIKPSGEKG